MTTASQRVRDAATVLNARLSGRGRPLRVLVLSDAADADIVRDSIMSESEVAAVVVAVTPPAGDPHAAYTASVEHGPFDAVVDLSDLSPEERRRLFGNAYYGLPPGGVYLQLDPAPRSRPGALAGELRAARSPRRRVVARVRRAAAPDLELTRAVAGADRTGAALIVTKRGEHLPKLRDSAANSLLAAARPNRMTVLDTVEPIHHESSTTVTMHGTTRSMAGFETVHRVPRLWLREYRGATVLPGQVVVLDGLVLPDTFRHNLAGRLRTTRLADTSHHYARTWSPLGRIDDLDGSYYHLDSEFGGRYGHLLTEQIGRLWGWDRAVEAYPGLRLLLWSEDPQARSEREVLTAFGIPADRITVLTGPARIERLVAASPMFQNPRYASPQLLPIWARIRDGLRAGRQTTADVPGRVFITRRGTGDRRACRNGPEVEAFFAARGFAVVDPGSMTLPDQAELFATAQTIAGFGGSAMINGVFGTGPSRRIILTHEEYTARNEHLIACLFGADQHYFWAPAEVAHPPGQWSVEAFHSPFTFDLTAASGRLDEILA